MTSDAPRPTGAPDAAAPSAPLRAKAVLETVLYAEDLVAVEAFYTGVLGLTLHRRVEGKFIFLTCGTQMLLIFTASESSAPDPGNPIPRHGAKGPGHICFRAESADEVARWRARFIAHGLTIEHDHIWPGGGTSVYVRDPAGNSVEVAEARIWGL